jgi:thymidylate kinase
MIVVFEGLSCVGKTSLIEYLALRNDCAVVKEWADYLDHMDESIERKCYLNDLYKTAALRGSSKLTLVDRYYPSTLACRYSESALKIDDYLSQVDCSEYVEPEEWVYVQEDVVQSITRSATHRKDEYSPWFDHEKARKIVQFYDAFFAGRTNVVRLNSSSVYDFIMDNCR